MTLLDEVPGPNAVIDMLNKVDISGVVRAHDLVAIAANVRLFMVLCKSIVPSSNTQQELVDASLEDSIRACAKVNELIDSVFACPNRCSDILEPLLEAYDNARESVMYLCGLYDRTLAGQFGYATCVI